VNRTEAVKCGWNATLNNNRQSTFTLPSVSSSRRRKRVAWRSFVLTTEEREPIIPSHRDDKTLLLARSVLSHRSCTRIITHDSINNTDTWFIFRILHLSRVAVKKFLDEEDTTENAGHGFSWCHIWTYQGSNAESLASLCPLFMLPSMSLTYKPTHVFISSVTHDYPTTWRPPSRHSHNQLN